MKVEDMKDGAFLCRHKGNLDVFHIRGGRYWYHGDLLMQAHHGDSGRPDEIIREVSDDLEALAAGAYVVPADARRCREDTGSHRGSFRDMRRFA